MSSSNPLMRASTRDAGLEHSILARERQTARIW
jgi:hypothetical protein